MTGPAPDGLTTEATRLLDALRMAGATSPARALTDAVLAERMQIDVRHVVDAAHELLAAGRLVLAGPRGRWLGTEAEALEYVASLRRRAKRILIRCRSVRRAIRRRHQLEFSFGVAS